MSRQNIYPIEGGCTCKSVRYRLLSAPLFVHCCHCSYCQSETGSAFAINALIEAERMELLSGQIERIEVPTLSGKGQDILRCSRCRVAVWSNYGAARSAVNFVRVGTLDDPDSCPPDIHIYTSTKLDWVILPDTVPAVEEYYQASQYWPRASLVRYQAVLRKSGGTRGPIERGKGS